MAEKEKIINMAEFAAEADLDTRQMVASWASVITVRLDGVDLPDRPVVAVSMALEIAILCGLWESSQDKPS